jgi:hypothetical protein
MARFRHTLYICDQESNQEKDKEASNRHKIAADSSGREKDADIFGLYSKLNFSWFYIYFWLSEQFII